MAIREPDPHAGKRECPGLAPGATSSKPDGVPAHWVHASRFRRRKRAKPNAPHEVMWEYDRICKTCQQTLRVDARHDDEATAKVERFAKKRAAVCKKSKQFMLDEMNLRRLIPEVAVLIEYGCPDCGSPPESMEDIEFDHIEPPRFDGDLAREHVSNIRPVDRNCNRGKGPRTWAQKLDDNEQARIAAHADRLDDPPPYTATWDVGGQMSMFDEAP